MKFLIIAVGLFVFALGDPIPNSNCVEEITRDTSLPDVLDCFHQWKEQGGSIPDDFPDCASYLTKYSTDDDLVYCWLITILNPSNTIGAQAPRMSDRTYLYSGIYGGYHGHYGYGYGYPYAYYGIYHG